ncbi:BON domain-containing protein [Rhizobium sp. S152]|uniref:BON domain-containing protein n=1 Tax=Rhizobium sp. S152 TaxID=3055038 RepID=UPI0025AA0745|nr:BON domain-containing protein [Rhizobium sp. S152]MDM9626341.1 BON domain-containing protein [Rhizobium sp. S152]
MVLLFQTSDDHGDGNGHGMASARASVESALRMAGGFDAREIEIAVLGPYIVLDGFVLRKEDVERAAEIAGQVVGREYVHCRILLRLPEGQ